jgi:hypothetical protein
MLIVQQEIVRWRYPNRKFSGCILIVTIHIVHSFVHNISDITLLLCCLLLPGYVFRPCDRLVNHTCIINPLKTKSKQNILFVPRCKDTPFGLRKPKYNCFTGKESLFVRIKHNLGDNTMSHISSILVITNARSSPSFSLSAEAQTCVRYIGYNYLEFRNQDRTVESYNSLHIFYQNVRRPRSKTDELINSLELGNINPCVLYFSDLLNLTLPGYILGSSCWKNLQKGGVCIVVCKDVCFSAINISCN